MMAAIYELAVDKEEAGFFREAFEILLHGALHGDAACQFRLGYYMGIAVKKSSKKAMCWYKKSMGSDREGYYKELSAHNMAVIYRERGAIKKSEKYFLKAIAMGANEDYLDVVLLYISSNIEKSVFYLMKLVGLECKNGVEVYQQRIARYLLYLVERSRWMQKNLLLDNANLYPRNKNKWRDGMTELDFALTLLVHGRLKKAKKQLKNILKNPKHKPRVHDIALTVWVAAR